MSAKLMMLSLFPMLLAMSGCAGNTTAPAVVSDYCRIAQPITYDSVNDTPETVKDIEAHNSRYECVCNHDCPKGS